MTFGGENVPWAPCASAFFGSASLWPLALWLVAFVGILAYFGCPGIIGDGQRQTNSTDDLNSIWLGFIRIHWAKTPTPTSAAKGAASVQLLFAMVLTDSGSLPEAPEEPRQTAPSWYILDRQPFANWLSKVESLWKIVQHLYQGQEIHWWIQWLSIRQPANKPMTCTWAPRDILHLLGCCFAGTRGHLQKSSLSLGDSSLTSPGQACSVEQFIFTGDTVFEPVYWTVRIELVSAVNSTIASFEVLFAAVAYHFSLKLVLAFLGKGLGTTDGLRCLKYIEIWHCIWAFLCMIVYSRVRCAPEIESMCVIGLWPDQEDESAHHHLWSDSVNFGRPGETEIVVLVSDHARSTVHERFHTVSFWNIWHFKLSPKCGQKHAQKYVEMQWSAFVLCNQQNNWS